MNLRSPQEVYNEKSENGFYVNKYGTEKQYYYLYTKKDKCPNPPRTDGNFYPSNIKNFVPQMEEDGDTNNNSNDDNNGNTQQQPQCQPQQQKRSEQLAQQNYFHSGKAWNLFMPHGTTKPDNDDAACAVLVKTFIEARIAVCEEGAEDWFTAVRGGNDSDDASHSEIENIQHKCRYIMVALQHALDKMGDGLTTWRECCEHALNAMKLVGIKYITCAETIERWHMQLRDSGDEKFPHPNPQVAAGQIVEPQFFVGCPTAKMMFLSHADELARKGTLTSEALADYVNAQVVPLHLNEFNEGKDETEKISRPNFLLSFGLGRGRPTMHQDENEPQEGKKNISQETILRWMKLYGYKWCTARKHYYNDTHEHPLTLKARKLYIHTVLFQYETRALRWIQIPKKDADLLRQQSADGKQHVADDAGYEYEAYDADGNLCCYVEFNVDDCKSFQQFMLAENKCGDKSHLFIHAPKTLVKQWCEAKLFDEKSTPTKAGYDYKSLDEANTEMVEVHARHFKDDEDTRKTLHESMRENDIHFGQSVRSPLLIFGQDEAIYRQYLMTLKVWSGRGGKQPQRPKDQGQGFMISAIKSRDFGFGYVLSAEQLAKVNEFRRTQRQEYSDTDAAMKVLGTCLKKDLERSPFVIMFDYGNSAEGYWTYDRMVLQLEDCIDVLDALHSSPYTEGNAAQRHMTLVPNTQDKLVRDYDYAFGFD
eukprot:scaffold11766_cov144-Skeletonema_dohrnii-CCMP3373.AAC.1